YTTPNTCTHDRTTPVSPDAGPPARTAADPRAAHAFTLSVDPFGNVLETVAIGYGRRYLDPALTPADQAKQRATRCTYVKTAYTTSAAPDDAYRAPLVAQSSTYELLQLTPDANHADITNLFRFDELRGKVASASDAAHDVLF